MLKRFWTTQKSKKTAGDQDLNQLVKTWLASIHSSNILVRKYVNVDMIHKYLETYLLENTLQVVEQARCFADFLRHSQNNLCRGSLKYSFSKSKFLNVLFSSRVVVNVGHFQGWSRFS